jgi:hypothetical protein
MHGSNIPSGPIGQIRRPCAICGRPFSVQRTGRKRLFCSNLCRSEARRQKSFVSPGYYPSAATQNAENSPTNSTTYRAENGGRSAPLDLVGGRYRWPGAVRLDPALRRQILAIEIGAPRRK